MLPNVRHYAIARSRRVCILSTADSSGNSRTAYAMGVKPTVISGALNGLSFDGIDRDDQSSGLNAGVTGFGVQTSDGSMNVTATIRRGRVGATLEVIAGKWLGTAGTINYLLFIDTANHLNFDVLNGGGTQIVAVGTTSLAANTTYTVEGNWTGSVLNVKVNGVQEGTTPALTALTAPDGTTAFTIGRTSWDSTDANSPYPFQGTIASASMTKGGVVQGQWAMTSVSCP